MIVRVENGRRVAIYGLTSEAGLVFDKGYGTVSVEKRLLQKLPRVGDVYEILGEEWRISAIESHTPKQINFLIERYRDGR